MNDFLPSIGTLTTYRKPIGDEIRVDDGYREGMAIPIFYDPMISKLVAHGKDRTDAIQKIKTAIKEYKIEGVSTTLPFGEFVFEHPAFLSGKFDTHFVKKYFTPGKLMSKQQQYAELASIIALNYWLDQQKKARPVEPAPTNWRTRLFDK